MNLKLICCKPMESDILKIAQKSNQKIDIEVIDMKYHEKPEELNLFLQKSIDNTKENYNALLLCMGLCSKGTAGLLSKHIPVVIIKAHDCITFSLGSKEKYKEIFNKNAGTYYFTKGWLENIHAENSSMSILDEDNRAKRLKILTEEYGDDNADFLLEMETSWISHYNRALFIKDDLENNEKEIKILEQIVADSNWKLDFEEKKYDILEKFLNGEWDSSEFIVLNAGEEVFETGDENILGKRLKTF